MKILHGTWIPEKNEEQFIQGGDFCLWVETNALSKSRKKPINKAHPFSLTQEELKIFLLKDLGITEKSNL